MKKLIQIGVVGFFLLQLAACGFHLRGQEPLPPQLKHLYLQTGNPYDPLAKELETVLRSAGVVLVQDAQDAPVTLQILSAGMSQQITGQGASGQLTAYLLSYSVTYQLLDVHGRVIQEPQTVTTTRPYSISANQVLGDTSVHQSLQNDMRRDAVGQLIYRLHAKKALQALERIE